jgi:ribosome-binding protein aMBF1 (putative translation factor)
MIRSEAEYKDAVARSRQSEQRLAEHRDELRCQGRSVDEIERTVGLAVDLLDDLNEQIGHYERIKRGDLSGFKTPRDMGQLLIAARVARDLSQRDLAARLGVHESQVSRDEKNEYQGVSLERASQILEVLSVRIDVRATLEGEISGGGSEHTGGPELRATFDGAVGSHEVST